MRDTILKETLNHKTGKIKKRAKSHGFRLFFIMIPSDTFQLKFAAYLIQQILT
ncbi:enoyl-CoA hydratase [Bacillus sp. SG-1]|nr:enoyl-CoA hydratase [Bacillus sp. SG-1]